MATKKWRIPTLTKADGSVIKAWQPRYIDYQIAELAMDLFNSKNIYLNLKNNLKSQRGVMLVMRDDGGNKDANLSMLQLIIDTNPIEALANEQEMEQFMNEISRYSV